MAKHIEYDQTTSRTSQAFLKKALLSEADTTSCLRHTGNQSWGLALAIRIV